jgi:signal peptidase I
MEKQKIQNQPRQGFLWILAGAALGVVIKLFVLDLLIVSGVSMEPALMEGNILGVNKLAYGLVRPFGDHLLCRWASPQQQDIIIYPYQQKVVVKRCVALGGDRLAFSAGPEYTVEVNGAVVPLTEHQYQRLKHSAQVPQGMVFAVGDNYHDSIDSRDYGFVSVKNVLGRGVSH